MPPTTDPMTLDEAIRYVAISVRCERAGNPLTASASVQYQEAVRIVRDEANVEEASVCAYCMAAHAGRPWS